MRNVQVTRHGSITISSRFSPLVESPAPFSALRSAAVSPRTGNTHSPRAEAFIARARALNPSPPFRATTRRTVSLSPPSPPRAALGRQLQGRATHLPPGWIETIDGLSGRTFWYHAESLVATWSLPMAATAPGGRAVDALRRVQRDRRLSKWDKRSERERTRRHILRRKEMEALRIAVAQRELGSSAAKSQLPSSPPLPRAAPPSATASTSSDSDDAPGGALPSWMTSTAPAGGGDSSDEARSAAARKRMAGPGGRRRRAPKQLAPADAAAAPDAVVRAAADLRKHFSHRKSVFAPPLSIAERRKTRIDVWDEWSSEDDHVDASQWREGMRQQGVWEWESSRSGRWIPFESRSARRLERGRQEGRAAVTLKTAANKETFRVEVNADALKVDPDLWQLNRETFEASRVRRRMAWFDVEGIERGAPKPKMVVRWQRFPLSVTGI